jgi:hypothetical protein
MHIEKINTNEMYDSKSLDVFLVKEMDNRNNKRLEFYEVLGLNKKQINTIKKKKMYIYNMNN